MKEIIKALIAAKTKFSPVLKKQTNPHLKSKYANLEEALDAVSDPLLENGIFMYQEVSEDPCGIVVETVFMHVSGEELRCGRLRVPALKQDPQGYGAALSYARRYSLLASCGIAAEDDDGQGNADKMAKQENRSQLFEESKEIIDLCAKCEELGVKGKDGEVLTLENIQKKLGVSKLNDASWAILRKFKNTIKERIEEHKQGDSNHA